jgi:uncharacterized protein YggE
MSVFGAATIDVAPDLARLRVGIKELRPTPAEAFAVTREAVNQVRDAIRGHGISDAAVTASRLKISSQWDYPANQNRQLRGYGCGCSFVVEVRDLDLVEAILVDVVAAGVNEVDEVQFDVRAKRELRAQARRAAVAAAREKAEVYAEAAGVGVGRVLHITDVDSDGLRPFRSHGGERHAADGDGVLTPGMISVSAGVLLGFAIEG